MLVGHYLTVGLLAAPLGLLGGRLLAPPLLGDTLVLLGTPQPGPPGPALAARRARCSCWPPWRWRARCRPGGRAACRRSSRSSRCAPARERASRAARVARALRLPVTAALGAKDAYVQRGRAALTVASLALAGAMVVCALAFEATMDRLAADPALRAQPWEVAVFTDVDAARARSTRLLASLPGVEAVGRRYGVLAMADGLELETRVIDGSPTRVRVRGAGRPRRAPAPAR